MASSDERSGTGLGTFAGVFTPSILTILGIILFLRMGYVVGSAGLLLALAMIVISNTISVLTSVSLSAIATNLKVKGGGDYYVISRTLGVEYGGALGVVLFLAQSISVAFYAIGFAEAIYALSGGPAWAPRAIAGGAVGVLFVLAWLGSDWATRFQYVVMAVLTAALIAFFVGGLGAFDPDLLRQNLQPTALPDGERLSFWVIFAIFFPAVTGFTQGVSMSGDLRDPVRSLPTGTFAAVGLSILVYLGVAIVFAGAMPGGELVADYAAMRRVSPVPGLIDAGVIAATLSSALASFMGAPRILQSLARDKVFPFLTPFARGHGDSQNPRRGVLLTLALAIATILAGDLNFIAPVVSMFFLISYGLLNYATYFEARANSPSFRPRFRFFDKRWSLIGALACLGAMVAIQPTAAIVAIAVLLAIFQYVKSAVVTERWADADRGHRFQRVRDDLHFISAELEHARDWRPVILAFTDEGERGARLLRFADWLEGHSGFTTALRFVPPDGRSTRKRIEAVETGLRKSVKADSLSAYVRAVVTDDPEQALPIVLQGHGLGRVKTNTILVPWSADRRPRAEPSDSPDPTATGESLPFQPSPSMLRNALRYACNIVIFSASDAAWQRLIDDETGRPRIDVWYRDNATGKLNLLLAYLMTRTAPFEDAELRLLVAKKKDRSADEQIASLRSMLDDVRIEAKPELVSALDARSVLLHSHDAGVTLLPFRLTDEGPRAVWGESLDGLLEHLGPVGLVLASQDLELESAPEAGRHAEIREALDDREEATKAVARLQKEVDGARVAAGEALHGVHEAKRLQVTGDELAAVEAAHRRAEEKLTKAERRLAKAQAKAGDADQRAAELADEAPAASGEATGDEDGAL